MSKLKQQLSNCKKMVVRLSVVYMMYICFLKFQNQKKSFEIEFEGQTSQDISLWSGETQSTVPKAAHFTFHLVFEIGPSSLHEPAPHTASPKYPPVLLNQKISFLYVV
jgi:hypothetical protein